MFTHGHARAGSRCGNRAAPAKLAVMDCPARPMHWSWLEPLALSKKLRDTGIGKRHLWVTLSDDSWQE
jgi:hypothetical protein